MKVFALICLFAFSIDILKIFKNNYFETINDPYFHKSLDSSEEIIFIINR